MLQRRSWSCQNIDWKRFLWKINIYEHYNDMETNRYLDGLKYIFATTCLLSLRLLRTQGLKFFIIRQEGHSLIKATGGPTLRFYPEQYSSYNCYLEWTQNLIFWQPRADTKPHFNGPTEEKMGPWADKRYLKNATWSGQKFEKWDLKSVGTPRHPLWEVGPWIIRLVVVAMYEQSLVLISRKIDDHNWK